MQNESAMQNDDPDYDYLKPDPQECPICMEMVDADDILNYVPNCVTCKNGHFLHRTCYDEMVTNVCPLCRQPVRFNCKGAESKYIQLNRKGGKKRRTTKKRKLVKRRKTLKKRKMRKSK